MLAMHIVVVGCGRVGSGLAVSLTDQGHSVALVDRSAKAFRRLPEQWPGARVVGSGFDLGDLDRAGARTADALAAVTSGDNSNILTARIARENYGIQDVVARIYDPRRAQIYQRLGIPTVATVTWTIDQVMRRLVPESAVGDWSDPTGKLLFVAKPLPGTWAGRKLSELNDDSSISVVAVTRSGEPRLDISSMIGQEGDILHLAVMAGAVPKLQKILGSFSNRLGEDAAASASGDTA